MTALHPHPTHTVPHLGQRIPVDIVGPSAIGGRPALRVEAAAGTPFTEVGMNGFVETNRADYPADLVRPIEATPATLRLGALLLDPDTPAEIVNAALSEWRRSEPRFRKVDEYPDDLDCDCHGFNNPNGCPACDAELETESIPFTHKEI